MSSTPVIFSLCSSDDESIGPEPAPAPEPAPEPASDSNTTHVSATTDAYEEPLSCSWSSDTARSGTETDEAPLQRRSRSRSPEASRAPIPARVPLRRQLAMGMLHPSVASTRPVRANRFAGTYASGNNDDFLSSAAEYFDPPDFVCDFGDDEAEDDEGDEGDDAATASSFDDLEADSTYSYGDDMTPSSTIATFTDDDSESVGTIATL
jgi:hypothetical protein